MNISAEGQIYKIMEMLYNLSQIFKGVLGAIQYFKLHPEIEKGASKELQALVKLWLSPS